MVHGLNFYFIFKFLLKFVQIVITENSKPPGTAAPNDIHMISPCSFYTQRKG